MRINMLHDFQFSFSCKTCSMIHQVFQSMSNEQFIKNIKASNVIHQEGRPRYINSARLSKQSRISKTIKTCLIHRQQQTIETCLIPSRKSYFTTFPCYLSPPVTLQGSDLLAHSAHTEVARTSHLQMVKVIQREGHVRPC